MLVLTPVYTSSSESVSHMNSAAPSEHLFETTFIPPPHPTLNSNSHPHQQQHHQQALQHQQSLLPAQGQNGNRNLATSAATAQPTPPEFEVTQNPQLQLPPNSSCSISPPQQQHTIPPRPHITLPISTSNFHLSNNNNNNVARDITPPATSAAILHHTENNFTQLTSRDEAQRGQIAPLTLPPILTRQTHNSGISSGFPTLNFPLAFPQGLEFRHSASPLDSNQNGSYFAQYSSGVATSIATSSSANNSVQNSEISSKFEHTEGLSFTDLHQINLQNLTNS